MTFGLGMELARDGPGVGTGRWAALLALAFVAFAPGAVQQDHFYIVDGFFTAIALAGLWVMGGRCRVVGGTGMCWRGSLQQRLVLLWCGIYFLSVGVISVKTVRYMVPLLPVLGICVGVCFVAVWRRQHVVGALRWWGWWVLRPCMVWPSPGSTL